MTPERAGPASSGPSRRRTFAKAGTSPWGWFERQSPGDAAMPILGMFSMMVPVRPARRQAKRAKDARSEAFDVILGNHMLYCTVYDNNNEDCRVHNTALDLDVQHQEHPFKPKPYEVDMSNPFYRYDPSQCILCGQYVQACQTVQVNETLSIGWELEHPRKLCGWRPRDRRIKVCFLRPLHHRLSQWRGRRERIRALALV
jgi:NADH-ubiquinone oxidoreductase-G iron-sulfur binding region